MDGQTLLSFVPLVSRSLTAMSNVLFAFQMPRCGQAPKLFAQSRPATSLSLNPEVQ